MPSYFLDYNNSKIHYHHFGNGQELLIAFHGYGDKGGEIFLKLEAVLEKKYQVIAIDLPYHGDTTWNQKYYSKKDIIQIVELLLEKYQYDKFNLMGYSMGGRICMGTLNHYSTHVKRLFLLAPDGLPEGKIIHAHMMPRSIRFLVSRFLQNSNWLIPLAQKLYQWKLINSVAHRFITINMKDEAFKNRLFRTWISLYEFQIYKKSIQKIIEENNIPLDLFFGERDKVIPVSVGNRFLKNWKIGQLHILPTGHRIIGEELSKKLKELF